MGRGSAPAPPSHRSPSRTPGHPLDASSAVKHRSFLKAADTLVNPLGNSGQPRPVAPCLGVVFPGRAAAGGNARSPRTHAQARARPAARVHAHEHAQRARAPPAARTRKGSAARAQTPAPPRRIRTRSSTGTRSAPRARFPCPSRPRAVLAPLAPPTPGRACAPQPAPWRRSGRDDGGERAGAEAGPAVPAGRGHGPRHPPAAGARPLELRRPRRGGPGRGAARGGRRTGRAGPGAGGGLRGTGAAAADGVGGLRSGRGCPGGGGGRCGPRPGGRLGPCGAPDPAGGRGAVGPRGAGRGDAGAERSAAVRRSRGCSAGCPGEAAGRALPAAPCRSRAKIRRWGRGFGLPYVRGS